MDARAEPGFEEFLAAVRRRWRLASYVAGGCAIATLLLALLLPPYFRSAGTILIEQQEVPSDLVRSTVTSYADQRVQVISQRVMTTQNLLQIIQRYDLYPRQRQREAREALIERMRDDIEVEMISADVIDPRSGLPRAATIAFTVGYTSRSADKAVNVANELTTLFLSGNVTERTRVAGEAASFLDNESARLSKEIADLEAKLAEFKTKNVAALPELQQLNLQLLDRAEQELRQVETKRMALEQQRVLLEAELAQLKPYSVVMTETGERILSPLDRLKMLRSQLASIEALYAPDHPDLVRLRREIAGLEREVGTAPPSNDLAREREQLLGELATARERYAPDHPDIVRIERRLAAIDASARTAGSEPTRARAEESADNPAWIQLRAEVGGTVSELRALDAQTARVRARIADYQRQIGVAPEVEREYLQLARDYESAQRKYQEVRSKEMEARLARNLEADRKGERFTLIEPPLPPEQPVSPNRLAILIIGLVLSLAATAGTVMMLELGDLTVRGRRDVVAAVAEEPLALIPRIRTDNELRQTNRRTRLATAAAAATVVMTVVAVHLFYRPVDVLWLVAMRRVGLY
jgi:uncharacterized protein involved in exopolysaccharide biosynthesis